MDVLGAVCVRLEKSRIWDISGQSVDCLCLNKYQSADVGWLERVTGFQVQAWWDTCIGMKFQNLLLNQMEKMAAAHEKLSEGRI